MILGGNFLSLTAGARALTPVGLPAAFAKPARLRPVSRLRA